MRTTEKGFPRILSIIMTLIGITWLMLLLTGSISTVGHLIFVIIAAWFFELFTNTRQTTAY